jgi:heat shock protein HslJ
VAIGGDSVDASLGQSATFADDGTVSGSGGCNQFSGSYTVDGESISIGPLVSSRMSCGDDADLSELHYLGALEAAVGFAISGTDLVITTSTGADLELSAQAGPVPTGSPEVTPEASPAATPVVTPATTPAVTPEASPASTAGASPAGTPEASPGPSSGASPSASGAVSGSIVGSWKLTTYVGSSLPPGMLSIDITFAPDGTFSGFGGCNDYSGQWSLDGTKLAITGFESASSGTCDPTSQSLEQGYFSLLPYVDTAELAEDGTLKLTASLAGDTGFEFQPAG